jgi:spermidine synthase
MAGKNNILYHGSSQFQDILLVEANDLRLYLNQELQFCSLDERHYHEALVFPVMEVAASNERVLILGGGDGLALREVLKYPNVKHVDLVDIDPMMIELAKTNPALLAQNNRSFLDSRVNVHIQDAKKYIEGELQPYNVIIIDFPDPVDQIISSLYTKELFSKVVNLLSPDGALVCQSNSPEDAPQVFWSIGKTIKKAGLNTLGYNVIVPSFGLWGFHLATHKILNGKIPDISVPHQALPTNMETLFEIPSEIKLEQSKAIVNSENQLKLHDLYQKEIETLY